MLRLLAHAGEQPQPSAAAAAAADAAAAAAGDDDLMAVDQILADLEEDALGQQQPAAACARVQLPGAAARPRTTQLSAWVLSTAAASKHSRGWHPRGYGDNLLQLQGNAWSPGGPLLNRPAGDTGVLPPGGSSSSRATADFSTPQQQQAFISLNQQEGVPADASVRAQEKSHRGGGKRRRNSRNSRRSSSLGRSSPFPPPITRAYRPPR